MTEEEAREVPADVAVCPICGERLWVLEIPAFEIVDDGQDLPEEVAVDCLSLPSVDSAEWRAWFNWHYAMPYVDWLPVVERVLDWLRKPEQAARVRVLDNVGSKLP